MVRRKGATIVLQLPARRAPRLAIERHMRLLRRPAALLQVARRAGGGDLFPARPPAQPPRHDMIEGQFLPRSTILASEAVAPKQVEAGASPLLRRLHILPKPDPARYRHRVRRRTHLALVNLTHRPPAVESRLHRPLPRPPPHSYNSH